MFRSFDLIAVRYCSSFHNTLFPFTEVTPNVLCTDKSKDTIVVAAFFVTSVSFGRRVLQ
jgi:hypothetical protein